MTLTIKRYKLFVPNHEIIKVTTGYKVMTARRNPQGDVYIHVAAPEQDLYATLVALEIMILPDGWDIPSTAEYVSTVEDGDLEYHVFYREV